MTTVSNASLLLDIGSSALKAAIVDRGDGTVHASVTIPAPAIRSDGARREFDPIALVAAVRDVTERVIQESAAMPNTMLVSTQMHTAVLTDAANVPLSPMISWQDNRLLERDERGQTHIDRLLEIGADVWMTSGIAHRPGFGAGNLGVWLKENKLPSSGGCRVHTVGSFVATALGAPFATHLTNAASLGLVDVRSGLWSPALQELHGLEHCELPKLRENHDPDGTVRLGGVELRWLGDIADHQVSVMGAGGLQPDDLAISLGTAGIAARRGSAPSVDHRVDSRPYVDGEFLLTVSRQPGGAVASIVARTLAGLASTLSGVNVAPSAFWERSEQRAQLKDSSAWVRFGTAADGEPEVSFGGLQAKEDVVAELYGGFVRAYVDAYQECVEVLFGADERPRSIRFNGGFAANNVVFRRALSAGLNINSIDVPTGDLALKGLAKIVAKSELMEQIK